MIVMHAQGLPSASMQLRSLAQYEEPRSTSRWILL